MDKELLYYRSAYNYMVWIANPNRDITGGITTIEDIDKLKEHPELDTVCVMGLKQQTFEYFINTYGKQFKAILFFKNKFVEDLSPLGELDKIEYICYFHNQRATRLWDMSKNVSLKGLIIEDFSRLHTLDDIPSAPNLKSLNFGNRVWRKDEYESLKPLASTKLTSLYFNPKKISDDDVAPLAEIKTLEELNFPSNFFTTEQIAWLKAKMPYTKGTVLQPYVKFDEDATKEGTKEVLICGKGKPFLNSIKDRERIQNYEDSFNRLVEQYRKE